MNPMTLSEDLWLPQWTPHWLIHKLFFQLDLKNPKEREEWPLGYVQGQISIFPDTLDIHLIDNMEQANFFVVDDDIRPTDVEYIEILEKARLQCIPILTRSDVERAHNYIAKPPMPDIEYPPIQFDVKVYDNDNGRTLTFDEKNIGSLQKREDAIQILENEILLRDPIVCQYLDLSTKARKEWSNLKRVFVDDPRRVVGTRWKIDDVQANYVSEAWHFLDANTCEWQWDEDKFNRDYGTPSDRFEPAKVVRAALFEFFIDNEDIIEDLAETIQSGIHSVAADESQQEEPTKLNDKSLDRLQDPETYEKVHQGKLVDAFSCPQCSERFSHKRTLLIHELEMHQTP